MKTLMIKIKAIINTGFEFINNHPHVKLIYSGFFMVFMLWGGVNTENNSNVQQGKNMPMGMKMNMVNFEPGDAYHVHKPVHDGRMKTHMNDKLITSY